MDATLAPAAYAPPQLGGTTAVTEVDEVVWWIVFVGFAYWYLGEPLKWNYAAAFVFLAAAVFCAFWF